MEIKLKMVFILGLNGFPNGFAQTERVKLLSKGLISCDTDVLIINRFGVNCETNCIPCSVTGKYEGINYIYCSGYQYRLSSFLKRNFYKIKGFFTEIKTIKGQKKDEIPVAIVSTMSFINLIYYYIVLRALKCKLILDYTEYVSAVRKDFIGHLVGRLFDKFCPYLADGIICISDFLVNSIKTKSKNLNIIKIPVLFDSDKFVDKSEINNMRNYFLFCGSAGYKEIILFIIKSFELIKNPTYNLILVLNGDIEEIQYTINKSSKSDKIKILMNLKHSELFDYYKNSSGLLIPLRPTIRDKSRFPFKIGEYSISGVPIITTGFGEINNYFTNWDNALIAEKYDIEEYAEKMKYVIDHPTDAKIIGLNGKRVGYKFFDYKINGFILNSFINNMVYNYEKKQNQERTK